MNLFVSNFGRNGEESRAAGRCRTAGRHALWAGGRHDETAVGIIGHSLDAEKIVQKPAD